MADDLGGLIDTSQPGAPGARGLFDRGLKFTPQGENGYDENWYPLCLSSEAPVGTAKGFDFLNGRVIAFRPTSGAPVSVLSAYCRHLGVDLSIGQVVGDEVRCPYHHWRYDSTGQCVATAVGDKPPGRAKLFRFPTAEALGLIWVYNGETPAYDVPNFGVDESALHFHVVRSVEVPMDPFMLFSNAMDLQHLRSVHGIQFSSPPDDFEITPRTISYRQVMTTPGIGVQDQRVTLWGTNGITLISEIMGRQTYMMSVGLAVRGPMTRTFNVTAVNKPEEGKAGDVQMIDRHIQMVEQFGLQLNREDDPVMRTVSPRLDNLTQADRSLAMYFNFARTYPRFDGATDMIRNDYRQAATPPGPQPPRLTSIAFEDMES